MKKSKYIRDQKRAMLLALMVACLMLVPAKANAGVDDGYLADEVSTIVFEAIEPIVAEEPVVKELPVRTTADEVWNEDPLRSYIRDLCAEANISPAIVYAIIERESHWDESAENGNCKGLMQIYTPSHRARMNRLGITDIMDPFQNVTVGIDILRELFETYEDPALVLMHYNMKPATADKLWRQGIISKYATEVLERSYEIEQEGDNYE